VKGTGEMRRFVERTEVLKISITRSSIENAKLANRGRGRDEAWTIQKPGAIPVPN